VVVVLCFRGRAGLDPAKAEDKMIHVVCTCGKAIDVTEKHAGKTLRCDACGGEILVPSAGDSMRPAMSAYEKAVLARLDQLGGIGLVLVRRLTIALVLLALLLLSSCRDFILNHR
jgi:hypothetical protein